MIKNQGSIFIFFWGVSNLWGSSCHLGVVEFVSYNMVLEGKTWRKGVMFIAFEPVMNMIQSITAFKLSSMFYKSLHYVHWWIFLFPWLYQF